MVLAHARISYPEWRDDMSAPEISRLLTGANRNSVFYRKIWHDDAKYGEDHRARLRQLGAMMVTPEAAPTRPDDYLPAGYTYFGQFIAHEISWATGDANRRSPTIDLDSLYGGERRERLDPETFELEVGQNAPPLDDSPIRCLDIAREHTGAPRIADARNDDLVTLSQFQSLFSRFHNRVVRCLKPASAEEACRIVIQHFQSVIVHDYLYNLLDADAHDDLIHGRRSFFFPTLRADDRLWLPLEFAIAAFRFGHSMVRQTYEKWNSDSRSATLSSFLKFTYNNRHPSHERMKRLPLEWVNDWSRLFPVPGFDPCNVLRSSAINTSISYDMAHIPPHALREGDETNIAVADLMRGHDRGLACAQFIIGELNRGAASDRQIEVLTPDELIQCEKAGVRGVLEMNNRLLAKNTPLWFYILKEAAFRQSGRRLGPLGSRLVGEVFSAVLEASPYSILKEADWRPTLPASAASRFTIADLLLFTGEINLTGGVEPCPA